MTPSLLVPPPPPPPEATGVQAGCDTSPDCELVCVLLMLVGPDPGANSHQAECTLCASADRPHSCSKLIRVPPMMWWANGFKYRWLCSS